ncbi:MAG: glycine dehydrogenase [Aquificota bacterium]|nr:glycine dehydrogenase [Aquificota bacterium]
MMEASRVSLVDLSISVPTVPYDLTLKELKNVFEELSIYSYLTVMKGSTPIGIVYRSQVEKLTNENLTAGDLAVLCCRLRNVEVSKESLIGVFELLRLEREPVIVTDRRGTYLGVLTYDTVLHYITRHKEHALPVVQKVHSVIGRGEYLCVFGLKNMDRFRKTFGSEKQESVYKILYEDIRDMFEGEISGVVDKGEIWVLSKRPPSKETVKEFFKEFHREYTLLFGEFQHVYVYGLCLDMSLIDSQEKLYEKKKELSEKARKIEGSVFIAHSLQPTLVLHDPAKQKIITNIKRKILGDFRNIVEKVRSSPKDMWEFILYDVFEEFPYFELFYIMSGRGLQITSNIVNPKVNYFL